MKKILISDKLSEAGINYLTEQSGIQVHIESGLNEEGLCNIIGDYDALIIRSATKVVLVRLFKHRATTGQPQGNIICYIEPICNTNNVNI